MPWGANSFARDMAKARFAKQALAKDATRPLALTDAVAPVKISVGGCLAELTPLRRYGSTCCENWKPPLL